MTTPPFHRFRIAGSPVAARPYGSGHIHATYLVESDSGPCAILQAVNRNVFTDLETLQGNVLAVTTHLKRKLQPEHPEDWQRRVLQPIPTHTGAWIHTAEDGAAWRAFEYIPGTQTIETVTSPAQARALGKAVGAFQTMLADFSGTLPETIPDFHDTRKRFHAFLEATCTAPADRLAFAREEIAFAETREPVTGRLLDLQAAGRLPVRITHNDTKINNILFDERSGEALCVIDLDTVMPGLSLYDFGDMVRTGTPSQPEDSTDLRGVTVDPDQFAALTHGYLSTAGEILTGQERSLLVFSGRLLTFETGLRFLTDFLAGDVYFRTQFPGQNLARARNQFRLLADMEKRAQELEDLTERVWERMIS